MKMPEKQKIYKEENDSNINMSPGDPKGSPDESFIFIDSGFLSKLSGYLGNGNYLRYDLIKFSKNLCIKQNLKCKKIYYYTAPPFQSEHPSKDEERRKESYDNFIRKITRTNELITREGRCQRLKIDGVYSYGQKAVDSLAIIDLMAMHIEHPNIKKIILIACDSDFVPVIQKLEEYGIRTILYTYYQKSRDEKFSTSNHLIKSVWKYVLLTKEDFDSAPLPESKKEGKA
jgi:uncharacterized LabA/DUF88 family protein